MKQHHLEVDLRHVSLYNDELAHAIQEKPSEILALVRPSSTPCIVVTYLYWRSSKMQQHEQLEQSFSLLRMDRKLELKLLLCLSLMFK